MDTLLGNYLYPYKDTKKRKDFINAPKFYLFDVGITNRLMKRQIPDLQGDIAGRAFQQSYNPKKSIVVNTSPRRRKLNDDGQDIDVYPWREFLEALWAGLII